MRPLGTVILRVKTGHSFWIILEQQIDKGNAAVVATLKFVSQVAVAMFKAEVCINEYTWTGIATLRTEPAYPQLTHTSCHAFLPLTVSLMLGKVQTTKWITSV